MLTEACQPPLFDDDGSLDHAWTISALVAACVGLMRELPGWHQALSPAEAALVRGSSASDLSPQRLQSLRDAIVRGADPLGEAFLALRGAAQRRGSGAVYTPSAIVQSMVSWLVEQSIPARVVDPGAGSGRFLLAAAAAFPDAELVGVETDPLAALMLRANAVVQGCHERLRLALCDYRDLSLPAGSGVTAFVGNPPYVRHHQIEPKWKAWYAAQYAALGLRASCLAGLHLHFYLQTCRLARPGDLGAFITSAEWLDVNYGSALRSLLLEHLGGVSVHVLEPRVEAFPGTATTAAIACFRVGEVGPSMRVQAVPDVAGLQHLDRGIAVSRARLHAEPRWSAVLRPTETRPGEIELGELFRVHRGQVTGANSIWIDGDRSADLPDRVRVPTVTKARDLIQAGARLRSADGLRRVIDLPPDLEDFDAAERRRIDAFLRWARQQGVHEGYVARNRKAWWAVGLRQPAPILCTYMARRAPQFTLNSCGARHINVAHGLYPREPMSHAALTRVVAWLNEHVGTAGGRTYAGGLTKFEPKEVERLRMPSPEDLRG
jgi:SAM-dependent methyltransferase